ncbi:alpha-1,2-mannosyltransferase ALG9-like [Saccoglossus kowalevskii]
MAAVGLRTRSHGSKSKRSIVRESERSTSRTIDTSQLQCWTPKAQTAFKIIISARFSAALLSNISDCDETFNYWEPVTYLPSSFSMYMTLLSMGAWYLDNIPLAILSTASSAIIGWPFAGALGIPIAIDLVLRRKEIVQFVKWCVLALLVVLIPVVMTDSHFYGKLVIAPLNIVLYNVFSEHGPDLYGEFQSIKQDITSTEERFLFPIYPFFCLCGAVTLSSVQKIYHLVFFGQKPKHYTTSSNWMAIIVGVVFAILSLSRSVALFHGYHAPLDVYPELTKISEDPVIHALPVDANVNVCVGKEWYRYTSSFFLPNDRWHLHFIQSDFRGQLPKMYSSHQDATRIIPTHMNDMNLEETSRYLDIKKCHYLIDLDTPEETQREPRYSQMKHDWSVVASVNYLDASRSHRFYRAFYVPFLSIPHNTYISYNILKNRKPKIVGRSKKEFLEDPDDEQW